jgi:uncharacterized repeat protein (TIGR01451 family)
MRNKTVGWLVVPTLVALLTALIPPTAAADPPPPSPPPEGETSMEVLPAWAVPAAPAAPQTLPLPYLSDPDVADAPFGFPPVVDGLIAPGEYAGAGKVTFTGYGGPVEVFFREDAAFLYVAFDLPAASPGGPNFADVYLDTDLDGDGVLDPLDFWLRVGDNGAVEEYVGDPTGWVGPFVPVLWNSAVMAGLTGGRWSVEFQIDYGKLGIAPPAFHELGLALRTEDGGAFLWPAAADPVDPSTWGSLVSSSDWGTFYWKPGPWEDYAPSGVPDFDQGQVVTPTYCGPFAAANSLWWFDSKFESEPAGSPGPPPSTLPISDSYPLVWSYDPFAWDDHDPQNVISLTMDLARHFRTDMNPIGPGTHIYDMYWGIQRYLRVHDVWDEYVVTLVDHPELDWIAEEVMRSEDVILLLGFWEWQLVGPDQWMWVRIGGHYVTVAGVDPGLQMIALSDPAQDWAEISGAGRVLSGTLTPHLWPHPGDSLAHNDAGTVSHDLYPVRIEIDNPSPGGSWLIEEYEPPFWVYEIPNVNPNPNFPEWGLHDPDALMHTEIEYALAVSPYAWKASGRWVEDPEVPLFQRSFVPFYDFAPSGVPDFDQKQDNWGYAPPPGGWQWSFCGPTAAANSLWWFDSKFERNGAVPPDVADTYPLVTPYGPWDDHDPLNVDDPSTPWPASSGGTGEFVEDLAFFFDTDGNRTGTFRLGTNVNDLYTGIDSYLYGRGLREGYVITQVQSPDFWWVAEEVERSEDVILLLGFWQWQEDPTGAGEWVRIGGHYVTLAGVDKQGGFVGFSDPFFDRLETAVPPNEFSGTPRWTGRVGSDGDPPLGPSGLVPTYTHQPLPHTGVVTLHNDAANVSHDVYRVVPTDSPGGVWGPEGYVESWGPAVENFWGQNGPDGVDPPQIDPAAPIQTEVEWAVAVSPVADVGVLKTVTPGVVGPGDWVTYSVAFLNAGSLPAQDVVLTETLPAELVNATIVGTWTSNGLPVSLRPATTFVWDLPDLAWRDNGLITLTAQVDPSLSWPAAITLTNWVTISTSSLEQTQVPPAPNVTSATVTVQTADLEITKGVVPTALLPGDWVTFTLAYTSHGPATANDVVITDALSSILVNESVSSQGAVITARPSTRYVWDVIDLATGMGGVITITAQVSPSLAAGGTFTNEVDIATSTFDRDASNDHAEQPFQVCVPPAGAGLSTIPAPPVVGQVVTFTGSVTRGDPVLVYTWDLSEGAFVSGNPVTHTYTISGNHTVWMTVTNGCGQQVVSDTLFLREYGLDLQPPSDGASDYPGATIVYTLTVTNLGNVADTYDVTATITGQAWTTTLPLTVGPVGIGGSAQFTVGVEIPTTGTSEGDTSQATVTVSSQGDATKTGTSVLTTEVLWRHVYLPLTTRNYP